MLPGRAVVADRRANDANLSVILLYQLTPWHNDFDSDNEDRKLQYFIECAQLLTLLPWLYLVNLSLAQFYLSLQTPIEGPTT